MIKSGPEEEIMAAAELLGFVVRLIDMTDIRVGG
jgi:hypothetical protein